MATPPPNSKMWDEMRKLFLASKLELSSPYGQMRFPSTLPRTDDMRQMIYDLERSGYLPQFTVGMDFGKSDRSVVTYYIRGTRKSFKVIW